MWIFFVVFFLHLYDSKQSTLGLWKKQDIWGGLLGRCYRPNNESSTQEDNLGIHQNENHHWLQRYNTSGNLTGLIWKRVCRHSPDMSEHFCESTIRASNTSKSVFFTWMTLLTVPSWLVMTGCEEKNLNHNWSCITRCHFQTSKLAIHSTLAVLYYSYNNRLTVKPLWFIR